MRRIKIVCGICLVVKYYSIHEVVNKICTIYTCEKCRSFYQKVTLSSLSLDCSANTKGSCLADLSFMKNDCQGCWAMRIMNICPLKSKLFENILYSLSEECKAKIPKQPLSLDEIKDSAKGEILVEIHLNDEWVPAPNPAEEISQLHINDEDEPIFEVPHEVIKNGRGDSSHTVETENEEAILTEPELSSDALLRISDLALEHLGVEGEMDIEEQEALVDDPIGIDVNDPSIITEIPDSAERNKRKSRKKVQYFSKNSFPGRRGKGAIYDQDGRLIKTGLDICDCLQRNCVGCHFPCPKCRSPKCGHECRANRKWYYEKVEEEGTRQIWLNDHM